MKIGLLDGRHPDYDADELRTNRALVKGGKYIRELIDDLLFKGANEPAPRYAARKARAYYINHCAPIVGQMVAWLGSALPRVSSEPDPETLDPFWAEFQGDCDLKRDSLHKFQMGRIREAFITGRGWTLCELPQTPRDKDEQLVRLASLADEDALDLRRAYLVALPTESVIDWEHDDDGELLWAIVRDEKAPRLSPEDSRGLRVVTWTIYDREGWQKYEWRQTKARSGYKPTEEATLADEGSHSFGVVPLEEFGLPEEFYILGKIRDHLVEAYNSRCAKSWGMYTNLMPTAVHNRVQAMEGASDTDIKKTATGAGYGVEIGKVGEEDLYFLESTGTAFEVAAKHIAELKDELYRVVYQMALSVDNSAGASKRSGDSKSEDKESSEIVLQALSEIDAPSRERKLNMVARARGEKVVFDVTPVEKFTLKSSEDVIQECLLAGSAGVRSPTFEKEREKKLVRALLPDLKEEEAEKIDGEIEDAVDADPDGAMGLVTPGAELPEADQPDGPTSMPSGEGAGSGNQKPRISAGAQRKANGNDGGARAQRRTAGGGRTQG